MAAVWRQWATWNRVAVGDEVVVNPGCRHRRHLARATTPDGHGFMIYGEQLGRPATFAVEPSRKSSPAGQRSWEESAAYPWRTQRTDAAARSSETGSDRAVVGIGGGCPPLRWHSPVTWAPTGGTSRARRSDEELPGRGRACAQCRAKWAVRTLWSSRAGSATWEPVRSLKPGGRGGVWRHHGATVEVNVRVCSSQYEIIGRQWGDTRVPRSPAIERRAVPSKQYPMDQYDKPRKLPRASNRQIVMTHPRTAEHAAWSTI